MNRSFIKGAVFGIIVTNLGNRYWLKGGIDTQELISAITRKIETVDINSDGVITPEELGQEASSLLEMLGQKFLKKP
jgi:hypothetical protein